MNQADTIKNLRKNKGLSLRKLAALTDISDGMLSNLENGKRTGTIEVLTKLANFYGVSIDYITCNPERNELIDKLLETLILEGAVDLDKPLTAEVKKVIEDAVNLKIKKLKDKNSL